MSRTDKDRPYWVRCEDPLEDRYVSHTHTNWRGEMLECDLDLPAKYKRNRWTSCDYWLPNAWHDGPPKSYRDHVWTDPERRRVRDDLGEICKLANAGGELEDVDFPNWQHRHGASWLWD